MHVLVVPNPYLWRKRQVVRWNADPRERPDVSEENRMSERKGRDPRPDSEHLAFTVCFACWMTNGVLITFLTENGVFTWTQSQIGWLIGIPVLTGAITRLPVGILTDKYGGRIVYTLLMLVAAIPMYLLGRADSYGHFLAASLGFGLTGASFAVGIAYTSVWFSKNRQGTALGIFGAGNRRRGLDQHGRAVPAPAPDRGRRADRRLAHDAQALRRRAGDHGGDLLSSRPSRQEGRRQPHHRASPSAWRHSGTSGSGASASTTSLVFGGFVALAQWLIPYYVNVST